MQLTLFPETKKLRNITPEDWDAVFEGYFKETLGLIDETKEAIEYGFNEYIEVGSQSKKSFEYSKEFYQAIFENCRYVAVKESDAAIYLFKLSIIVGNYKHQQVMDTEVAVKPIEGLLHIKDLAELFKRLFCRWEVPEFLVYNLAWLEFDEIDVLMFHCSGQNIRKHPRTNGLLSKKESHVFVNYINKNLNAPGQYLDRAITAAKLLSYYPEAFNQYDLFLGASNHFILDPEDYFENLHKWGELFRFLYEDTRLLTSIHRLDEILDFYGMKIEHDPEFSLAGRTMQSLDRLIDRYHQDIYFGVLQEPEDLEWEARHNRVEMNFGSTTWRLLELTNTSELIAEGNAMEHCVGSYASWCHRDKTNVFSVQRHGGDKQWERVATLEYQNGEVTQLYGLRNSDLKPEDKSWLICC